MGTFQKHTIIVAALKADAAVDLDGYLADTLLSAASADGYHPIGTPWTTWHEITQAEEDRERALIARLDFTEYSDGEPAFHAGDWLARTSVAVIEDAPIEASRA